MHKASVFLLSTPIGLEGFSSTTFLSDSNDLSVFLLSFSTRLGGFLSINLSGFLPQFSYWVRRFFHQDRMTMFLLTTYYQLFDFLLQLSYRARRFFINDLFIYDFVNDFSIHVVNDFSVFLLSFPLG